MPSREKKQHLETVFQRHIDTGKAIGGIIMVLSALALAVIHFFMDEYDPSRLYYIFGGIGGLAAGFFLVLWYMSKQELADQLNDRLYAVWHYQPECIYSFYRLYALRAKLTRFYNGLLTAAILLIVTLLFRRSETTYYVAYISLAGTFISLLYALTILPYSQYLLLKIRTRLLGDATEVIFSRGGIWYCGKVYNFGRTGITYHRVERKEYRGRDAIVFYYTLKRGYQSTAMELWVPIPAKMAYAADALVAEFNRSDLLSIGKKSYEH